MHPAPGHPCDAFLRLRAPQTHVHMSLAAPPVDQVEAAADATTTAEGAVQDVGGVSDGPVSNFHHRSTDILETDQ